jgi:hypothetical protein
MKEKDCKPGGFSGPALQDWVEEVYFDGAQKQDSTREDISRLGQVLYTLSRVPEPLLKKF